MLSEALPVTQHGRREGGGTAHFRVQSIVRVSRQRLPSKAFWAASFSAPAFYFDVGARQAPGKVRLAPSSFSAGILLSRGWSPEANYSLLCCPNPRRAFGEEHCFEGGKAWLTSHFEEATGLECFHQMMHVGGAISIPSDGPIRPGLVGKRFT